MFYGVEQSGISYKGKRVDALTPVSDEGRGRLR